MKTVVFMGTPDFAVPALRALLESLEYDVKLVISQADKPQGRHQVLTPPPVKELALQYNVEIYQPSSLKCEESYEKINALQPDFIVVSAYGKILPQNVLDIPRYGCVNLHGSLLPKYRGAAPIQWSVINGEKQSGVTTMLMNAGLDTGDMLLVSKTDITENETAGELFEALSELCPELLLKTLNGLVNGTVQPIPQNEADATYVSVLSKEMAVIDWNESAFTIHNKVRGMNPWPIAKTAFQGKTLKIYSTRLTPFHSNAPAGTVLELDHSVHAVCGNGTVLRICEVQAEGGKRMPVGDFIRGHSDFIGALLK